MKIQELIESTEPFVRTREREVKLPKPTKDDPELANYKKPSAEYTVRTPELEKAAELVKNGEMTSRDYWKLVGKYKPVTKYKDIPEPASIKDLVYSLHGKNQYEKIDVDIPDGELVHLRLDINAYKNSNVWAPTIHAATPGGGIGTTISHMPSAIVNNASMHVENVKDISHKQHPVKIATGEHGKYPVATITGNYEWATPADAKKQAQAALTDPSWIQVGMDPRRHSYFYDRSNRRPVVSGSRAIQVGGIILLKDPKYGKRSDYVYETGLDKIFKELDEEIFNELTFHGSQCTKDCSGHRAGYNWAAKKAATVKQNTPSSSFNNGTEIAIRRRNPTTGYVPPSSIRGTGGKFQKFQQGKTT